jgi:pullulanase
MTDRPSLALERHPLQAALVLLSLLLPAATGRVAFAADTPDPARVTLAGSLESEIGCSGDWQPDCALAHLAYDKEDGVWQGSWSVPAGSYEYKVALNDSWTENYGLHARRDGDNIPLSVATAGPVKFYYDHETHWATDDRSSVIAVAPGSFQSRLGCASDWDPSCLRSWLEDPDGDGIYTFRTRALPAGSYEVKVAIHESWSENYGAGGAPNGPNIPFTVPADCTEMLFSYNAATHLLSVGVAPPAPQPGSVTIPGSFQSAVGCSGDWQPDCALTHLGFDLEDGIWQGTFTLPAGSFEYKAAIDDSWTENYGKNATPNGPNIPLSLSAASPVKFYYDSRTHWVTDNRGTPIAVVPGSFQSKIGCAGDWDPSCLRSWLEDPAGTGISSFSAWLPAGNYEAKVAINESWAENYGAGGAPNGANIPFSVARSCTQVFFTYDGASHKLTIGAKNAPKGNLKLAKALWVTGDTLAWSFGPVQAGQTFRLSFSPTAGLALDDTGGGGGGGVTGGASIALTYDPAGLSAAVRAKFPYIASYNAFKISPADLGQVRDILKGQLAVSAADATGALLDATSVQIPGVLDDLFPYDGPLGVSWSGGAPTLRVWAPTAQSVALRLFPDSNPATAATTIPMIEDPATGVWSASGPASWNRQYYLYQVAVYAPSTGKIETNQVTDPYSLSLAADSARSQIVNLDDPDLQPFGWSALPKPRLRAPEDISIYELHVRDFSIGDATVPAPWRGTFRAFTVAGSNGMRHLAALAQAGLTHIHLLPSFDISSVPERREDQLLPAGDLASFPPDSPLQQAAIAAVRDSDGFNWGYDPWHYTVPEGSYATDPDGPARVREFREMVEALNLAGLRVVMDVVYNHTTAAGQNPHSVLDQIVPGYYYRLDENGVIATSSCCPNTASEHAMMEKLMVDSLLTWARAYKVDGFRFDLMGHHMKSNILKIRDALQALTPAGDGVDGSRIYLYGEGWNFGEVAGNARGVNATQANMAGTGVGTFNDRLRDAVRGGGPFSGIQEQGFGNGLWYDPNGTDQGGPAAELGTLLHRSDWIRTGLAGQLADFTFVDATGHTVTAAQVDYQGQPAGYTVDPQEVIHYVDAHDNETLWDTIALKAPVSASMAERVRMQTLSASLAALAQGIPFFHAGIDILRSKSLDRNSYNSGDWFNRLDFTYGSNNWGVGLPPAGDNQANWPIQGPLLANPALKPATADILAANARFRELLALRQSSRLFRLPSGDAIRARLQLLNTGAGQTPGLLGMALSDDDGAYDRLRRKIVVLWNATPQSLVFSVADLAGHPLALHPIQAHSSDPVVRTATFAGATGTFTIPARTAAVFVEPRPLAEQVQLLAGDVRALVEQGVLNQGQGNALEAKLDAALRELGQGNATAAAHQLGALAEQVRALVQAGILTGDQGDALLGNAGAIVDQLNGGEV